MSMTDVAQPTEHVEGVAFDELADTDLVVDEYYYGGRARSHADDPIGKLLPVGNQGGFRHNGSLRTGQVRMVVLFSTGRDTDWPDLLDQRNGIFTYYGDNKEPGKDLHATQRGGNILLRDTFARCYGDAVDRESVPPFFLFTKAGAHRDVRFRGLLAPGSSATGSDDDLQAIWRSKDGLRFQNYRARFTVLDESRISRSWIREILAGTALGPSCPPTWRQWVAGRAYKPLLAEPTTIIRSREAQAPADADGQAIIGLIHSWFSDRPHDFEACAVELWRMIAPATGQVDLTRPTRDGGRDAVGQYPLGPLADRINLDFALEAKCYGPRNSVGVREVSRLISRIRHRMFGVLVTTSHIDRQAYDEVRSDGHPIILVSANDIVEALRGHGYASRAAVEDWLAHNFPHEE